MPVGYGGEGNNYGMDSPSDDWSLRFISHWMDMRPWRMRRRESAFSWGGCVPESGVIYTLSADR
jgi:hypothetical protein